MLKIPAVFLDRDGTLNVDVGYPGSLEKIELIPGATEAVKRFNALGMKVIVVSNQSGVARGFFDEAQLQEIHRGMQQMFAEAGARIDAFYYCPFHPDYGTPEERQKSRCRKPNPDMFYRAEEEYGIDLSRSVMIGDKYSDVEAGKRLGMLTMLVRTGAGEQELAKYQNNPAILQPDRVVKDILAAAELLKESGPENGGS